MKAAFPQYAYDLDHDFGNDVKLSPTNDLLNITSLGKSQQRVLRRLMTPPGSYIWHPNYGGGLQQYVGQTLSPDLMDMIKSKILAQIFLEDSVARSPVPTISLQTIQEGLFVQINYTENTTQKPIVLSFNVI